MQLSNRLQAVAHMVTPGHVLADVGTDHGYIPIYLVQIGRIKQAIAMDLRKGPLEKAISNIKEAGLTDQIQTRLSDGVMKLQPLEVDSITIAGMGGGVIQKILKDGASVFVQAKEFILQPQTEIEEVRRFLIKHGYEIIEEHMIEEEQKFYPMMKVINNPSKMWENVELRYGKLLLQSKNLVLLEFLQREKGSLERVLLRLEELPNELHILERKKEVEYDLKLVIEALSRYNQ